MKRANNMKHTLTLLTALLLEPLAWESVLG
jgi:hypothetical protein